MGVSGCGKSTLGLALAGRLGCRFLDGDNLHPEASRIKMAAGTPLTDFERRPWLDAVGRHLGEAAPAAGTVIACSALRRAHRQHILQHAPDAKFVHLHGPRVVLAERLRERRDHFFDPALLDSQLDTLEELGPDEPGEAFDLCQPLPELLERILHSPLLAFDPGA